MGLSRYEMESIVSFNTEEPTAVVFTRDRSVMRKMDKLCERRPDLYRCTERDDIGAYYEAPKKLISFRVPRELSEAQKKHLENMRLKAST